jgi:predicted nucleotidyltransferase
MAFPPRPELPALLASLTRALEARGLPFMLIGGQAVLVHGTPRLTEDVDVTLAADPSRLPDVLTACADAGLTPLPEDPVAFVHDTFVLPARHAASGLRTDFVFSTTAYEREAIARSIRIVVEGVAVPVATAEDLLLHKLFAGRPRDIEDAESVVRRSGPSMDWVYVERWARTFAEVPGREEMPAAMERLRRCS